MPRTSKLPAPQVLAGMIACGRTQTDIAAEYGVSCVAVSLRLTRADFSGCGMLRVKLQSVVARYGPYLAAREQGLTYQRIGDLFGVSGQAARVSVRKARAALAELQPTPTDDYADQPDHFIARIAA